MHLDVGHMNSRLLVTDLSQSRQGCLSVCLSVCLSFFFFFFLLKLTDEISCKIIPIIKVHSNKQSPFTKSKIVFQNLFVFKKY